MTEVDRVTKNLFSVQMEIANPNLTLQNFFSPEQLEKVVDKEENSESKVENNEKSSPQFVQSFTKVFVSLLAKNNEGLSIIGAAINFAGHIVTIWNPGLFPLFLSFLVS
jgi:hypothetical protein